MIKPILQALGRAHMDIKLRSGDLDVRIIERPGLWMTDAELFDLAKSLRAVAADTLSEGSLNYGVFLGAADTLRDVIITLVLRADGTAVAFNALAIMQVDTKPEPTEVLHLGLVMVIPEERSKNLSWVLYGLTCFLLFFRRQFRPVWVSNVTQVPAVFGMVSKMFSHVWPQPAAGRRTLNHILLARLIVANHRHVFGVGAAAGFDETGFVITNAYTGGSDDLKKSWDEAPKHREAPFNTYCADKLNYVRGDDLLQLGQMDLPAMRNYLIRDVPKSQVVGLLFAASFMTFQRLVLPVLHWADSTRHWSILRPAKGVRK